MLKAVMKLITGVCSPCFGLMAAGYSWVGKDAIATNLVAWAILTYLWSREE